MKKVYLFRLEKVYVCIYVCMLYIRIFTNTYMPKLPSPSPAKSVGLVKTSSQKNPKQKQNQSKTKNLKEQTKTKKPHQNHNPTFLNSFWYLSDDNE